LFPGLPQAGKTLIKRFVKARANGPLDYSQRVKIKAAKKAFGSM
jgi:hypothetical protein